MRKGPSRRRFLKGTAAAIAWLLGLSAESGCSSITGSRTGQGTPGDLPHQLYLPLIAGGLEARGPSKLGLHTIRPGSVSHLVGRVSDAGGHVALVKALDDFGYLAEVKAASPATLRVARRNDPWGGGVTASGDPAEAAQERMDWHMPVWELNRKNVDYWEVLNEADPPGVEGHRWLAEFFITCMAIAQRNDFRLAIFSYSVGVPEWEEWAAVVETGVFQRAKMGGHILALHEYNWPHVDRLWGEGLPSRPAYPDRGVLTGRYRHLYEDFLIPQDQVVPLVITEAGYDPSVFGQGWDETWKSRYVSEMAWYDDRLREDDYVIGCALFTLGAVGIWQDWDLEELLDDLGDYFISQIDGA
jgi:hypothetical protein